MQTDVTPATRKRLLIVHVSASGGTRALVSALRDGAQANEHVEVLTRSAPVCTAEALLASDGIVFATPENFGYMAGEMKAMFDRVFYRLMRDSTSEGGGIDSLLAGRPYAVIVCAGNDGRGALASVERIVTGWRMRPLHEGLIVRRVGGEAGSSRGSIAAVDIDTAHALGEAFATALELGIG